MKLLDVSLVYCYILYAYISYVLYVSLYLPIFVYISYFLYSVGSI